MEIWEYSATQLRQSLDNKEFSSQELIKTLLQRIDQSKLNAFISVLDLENAQEQAYASDERRSKGTSLGFWDGLPIAVKDNICTACLRTTSGSKILKDFVSPYDAHVIEMIKQQGGIVIGKTNLDEFAMGSSGEYSYFGPTQNPCCIGASPGGSSSGSAAAVSGCLVPIALGSDTGGSVRQPASMTGIFGLKPTYGRISRFGLVAFASSLDQIGILGRNIADIAHLLEIIATPDPRDATCTLQKAPSYDDFLAWSWNGKTIGVAENYFHEPGIHPDIASVCKKSLDATHTLGAKVVPIELPEPGIALSTYYVIASAEASSNLARYDGIRYGSQAPLQNLTKDESPLTELYMQTRNLFLGQEVKRRILLGTYVLCEGYARSYYQKAQQARQSIRNQINTILEKVDYIATPTSPIPAFQIGEKVHDPMRMYLCDLFTVMFSLSGHPAISMPIGFTQQNAPIGLQLIGKFFAEKDLLQAADSFPQPGK